MNSLSVVFHCSGVDLTYESHLLSVKRHGLEHLDGSMEFYLAARRFMAYHCP